MAEESPQPEGAAEADRAEDAPNAPEANSAAASTIDAGDTPAPSDASTASADESPNAAPEANHAKRREMTGVVLSNKADKTISVRIDRRVKHPVYGKIVRRSSKLAAHDERNECSEGDVVTIVETRPISKTKSWRLGRIVERAGA